MKISHHLPSDRYFDCGNAKSSLIAFFCHKTTLTIAFIHSWLFSLGILLEKVQVLKLNIKLHPCLAAGIHWEIPLTTSAGLLKQNFNYHLLIELGLSLLGIWLGRAILSSWARQADRCQNGERNVATATGQLQVWMKEAKCVRSRDHRGA